MLSKRGSILSENFLSRPVPILASVPVTAHQQKSSERKAKDTHAGARNLTAGMDLSKQWNSSGVPQRSWDPAHTREAFIPPRERQKHPAQPQHQPAACPGKAPPAQAHPSWSCAAALLCTAFTQTKFCLLGEMKQLESGLCSSMSCRTVTEQSS